MRRKLIALKNTKNWFFSKNLLPVDLVLKTPPLRSRYCTNMCWRKHMYRAELLDFSTQHKLSLQSEYFLAYVITLLFAHVQTQWARLEWVWKNNLVLSQGLPQHLSLNPWGAKSTSIKIPDITSKFKKQFCKTSFTSDRKKANPQGFYM